MRAELEGVTLKPYEKPKMVAEEMAIRRGTCAFRTNYQPLNNPPIQTPRGKPDENDQVELHEGQVRPKEPPVKADIVGFNKPKRYYVV